MHVGTSASHIMHPGRLQIKCQIVGEKCPGFWGTIKQKCNYNVSDPIILGKAVAKLFFDGKPMGNGRGPTKLVQRRLCTRKCIQVYYIISNQRKLYPNPSIYLNVFKCNQFYPKVYKCIEMFSNVPKYIHMYSNVPKWYSICKDIDKGSRNWK